MEDLVPSLSMDVHLRPHDFNRNLDITLYKWLEINAKYRFYCHHFLWFWPKNPAFVKIQHVTFVNELQMKNHPRFGNINYNDASFESKNYLFNNGRTSYLHINHFYSKLKNDISNIVDCIVLCVNVNPIKRFKLIENPKIIKNTLNKHEFEYYPKKESKLYKQQRPKYLKNILWKDGTYLDQNKNNLNTIFKKYVQG